MFDYEKGDKKTVLFSFNRNDQEYRTIFFMDSRLSGNDSPAGLKFSRSVGGLTAVDNLFTIFTLRVVG